MMRDPLVSFSVMDSQRHFNQEQIQLRNWKLRRWQVVGGYALPTKEGQSDLGNLLKFSSELIEQKIS